MGFYHKTVSFKISCFSPATWSWVVFMRQTGEGNGPATFPSPSHSLTPSPPQGITAQSTLTTKPKHLRVPKNSCSCQCLGVPGWKRGENWSMHRKKNLKPQKATIYVIVSPPEYELVSLALFLLASGSRYKKYYHHCACPCFPVACLFAKWLFSIELIASYNPHFV